MLDKHILMQYGAAICSQTSQLVWSVVIIFRGPSSWLIWRSFTKRKTNGTSVGSPGIRTSEREHAYYGDMVAFIEKGDSLTLPVHFARRKERKQRKQ